MLTAAEIDAFIDDGYVLVRSAVDADVVVECRAAVWAELETRGIKRDEPATWRDPEVRVPCPEGGPFVDAGTSPALWEAYDQLVGDGGSRWGRRKGVGGSVVIRFPSEESVHVGGDGWHIESWYPRGELWWSTAHSETRALLALFLFTDVGIYDAPTALLRGSHADAAALLGSHPDGIRWQDVRPNLPDSTFDREVVLGTGSAGDVILVHPLLVHRSTWPHRGDVRMVAQPSIFLNPPYALDDVEGAGPIERAIIQALR